VAEGRALLATPSRPRQLYDARFYCHHRRANLDSDTIESFNDSGLRLFLVGYESGNEDILKRIKKGVTRDEMRSALTRPPATLSQPMGEGHATTPAWSFTARSSSACRSRTPETVENTIRFAQELDVFSIQVSLAAPDPGTELHEQARPNSWFVKQDKADLVEDDGFQQSALEYAGLSKDEIFEAVDRFYRAYYLRPKPILRIIQTMLEDNDVFVRRCREGCEFFRSLNERKEDLEAARACPAGASAPAVA